MTAGTPIKRFTTLTPERFAGEYLRKGRPVIVSRPGPAWGPMSAWSPEYLTEKLADRSVTVALAAGSQFHYDPAAGKTFSLAPMTFREAAARICRPELSSGVYLMQQSIAQNFPELAGDVRAPDLLGGEPAAPHLWFGSGGNVTPLHYDPLNNFFLQLYGRKRFLLFDARHLEEIYPLPVGDRYSHISRVDAERPDLELYPRFRDAEPWEALLEPGDLLFLPPFWWHHVRSLEVAVSLNFWSAPSLAQCLVPAGLRLLVAVYEHDRLATMGAPFRGPGGYLAPAHEVLALGMRWPAVLLAGAALELPLRASCAQHGIAERTPAGVRSLAAINRELVEAGAYSQERANTIGRLDRLIERARQQSEALLSDQEVAGFLEAVEGLLVADRPVAGHDGGH